MSSFGKGKIKRIGDVFLSTGGIIGGICAISLVINHIFDSNLMFISKDFPGTSITILYHLTGKLFTPIMIISQMTLPFLLVYGLVKSVKLKKNSVFLLEKYVNIY